MKSIKKLAPQSESIIDTTVHFKELLKEYPVKQIGKGKILFLKGKSPTAIYYLEEGTMLITDMSIAEKEIVLNYKQSPSFLNLASITNRQSYPYTARSLKAAIVRIIPIQEFQFLLRRNVYLNQLVINCLVRSQEKNHQRYARTVALDSKSRIISFLLNQVQEQGKRVGYEWVIHGFFSQKEVALLTNTTRQTVSSILNELRRQRIIHYRHKYFIVRDLAQLGQYLIRD